MLKVLFITNIPSPYRVDFFNELGKLCDLTVLFEKATSSERDASWKHYNFENFNGIFLKSKSVRVDAGFSFEVIKYVKDRRFDRIIVANTSTPTGMLALQYMKNHGIPYYLEGDGGFAKTGKGLKERIKKHFIKGAQGYFSTGAEHDRYYITYGAEPDKIYRYPFTSLYESDLLDSPVTHEEKLRIRETLSMKEEKIIVTVGQFIHRKGFDVLLKSAKHLGDDCGIYFVGGSPTDEYLSIKESLGLQNVHFVGFKLKEELKEYYKASDLFVLPTREDIWGLVVNEAMACGLPVVTTDKCIAGLELVENGANGYIVPVDDEEALASKILEALNDPDVMPQNSLTKIKDYTIQNMAKRHIEILNHTP